MKKSGKNIGQRLCEDYSFYSKIKGFAKKHSSRIVKRVLNKKPKLENE
jgi:hypothetical protein